MKGNILSLAKKLISIPSETGDIKSLERVLEICKKELTDFTIEEFSQKGYPSLLIYKERKRPKNFSLILNGHLDVVAADASQFTPIAKNGRLYGRGGMDMKAAVAAQIVLFRNRAHTIDKPIALQLVTDEETGGFNGTKFQIDKGVRGDFVIAGEPTDMGINTESKGILWAKLTFSGKSSHAAYPWNGENAIYKASQFIQDISRLYPVPKNEEWRTTINFSAISTTNTTANKVPGDCSLTLDIRFIPGDKENVLTAIKIAAGSKTKVEILVDESVHFTDKNNVYVKKLASSIKKVSGKSAKIIVKHGGSDIRFYNEIGIPGVTIGPIGKGLHADDEWVHIQSLVHFYQTLEDFLFSL